ncbi:MAG: dihydroneopterin aldolase, partial [Candidatus Bathyarchaeia archaeon]
MKTGGIGRILIRNLRLRCIIGTNDYERVEKQDVVINVAMSLDISAAAQKDDISDTVNYKLVSSQIVKMVEDSSFYLIETLAEKIAEIC